MVLNPGAVFGSVCAVVKIQIEQTVSLERQGFEAFLSVSNASVDTSLDNVNVEVNFTDEEGNPVLATSDPNNTEASFFINVDSMKAIDAVDGTGVILPNSVAEVRWLIIPAPGASNGFDQGTLYYVGATLDYKILDENFSTIVSPDYIHVKPMPELTLDYFLPEDVLW